MPTPGSLSDHDMDRLSHWFPQSSPGSHHHDEFHHSYWASSTGSHLGYDMATCLPACDNSDYQLHCLYTLVWLCFGSVQEKLQPCNHL